MRVAMVNITAGGMSGGYRKYLTRMVPRLAQHSAIGQLLVATPVSVDLPTWDRDFGNVHRLQLGSFLGSGRYVGRDSEVGIRQFSPDVLFIPTGRFWSLKRRIPVVTMPRNMAPFVDHTWPTPWSFRIRNWARRRDASHAVRRADRVIAISAFVKDRLIECAGVGEEKIDIVYFGADLSIPRASPLRPRRLPISIDGPYLFTGGVIYPYRGLEDIVIAVSRLDGERSPVVISGKVGQGMDAYYGKLRQLVAKRGLCSEVHFVGPLDASEMAWCYENCTAFVMTSRVEACPNMALEAMSHGCVCIAADSPPLPEFFRDCAVYYPAGRADLLADKINMVLGLSDAERQRFKQKAIDRAKCFGWDVCCDGTVSVLRGAITDSGRSCGSALLSEQRS